MRHGSGPRLRARPDELRRARGHRDRLGGITGSHPLLHHPDDGGGAGRGRPAALRLSLHAAARQAGVVHAGIRRAVLCPGAEVPQQQRRDRAYDHDFAMQIVYRVDGDPRLPEEFLEHLAGFDGARPVRIGNRAAGQRQLDVFGAVIDCMAVYQRKGGFISAKLWMVIERFADGIWARSRELDNGIWEFQGERKHHTHSKLWCWVALDRAITLAQGTGNTGHLPQWERAASDLRAEIEARAWN